MRLETPETIIQRTFSNDAAPNSPIMPHATTLYKYVITSYHCSRSNLSALRGSAHVRHLPLLWYYLQDVVH